MMVLLLPGIKCEYPGCDTWFGRGPKQRFCTKHTLPLLEVAKNSNKNSAPLPTAPTPQSPQPEPPTPPTSGSPVLPTGRRVRHGHREQIEVLKRKIAKRARDP